MSTVPSLLHAWVLREVNSALRTHLIVVRQEDRAMLGSERIRGVPALLVEILSPFIMEYDLVTKRTAYARAGVSEYWIVRPATRNVLVCTDPDTAAGPYLQVAHVQLDAGLVSPTLPFRVAIAGFFVGAQLTAL